MSKPLIVGNWKMNLNLESSRSLARGVETCAAEQENVEVVVLPATHALSSVKEQSESVKTGIQNIYFHDEGAFTGEVAAAQASELAEYAVVGHSERRHIFGETNEMVARKASACIRNGITPIICVGETQHEREENETTQVLNDQLATGLTMLTGEDVTSSIIAYEPVWAIGTGNNAMPDDVETAIAIIRHNIEESFGGKVAENVRVLYGGSVSSESAGAYLDLECVNGLLVGGASLDSHEFNSIIVRAAGGEQ